VAITRWQDGLVTLVTLRQVRAAQRLLTGVASVTPVVGSRVLSELIGGPVHLKCENLQRTGSFKIRGAYTRIAGLTAAERAGGVVAASAGNHAQGVALAAALLDTKATVFMPGGAALPKLAATVGYGATVHSVGDALADALAAAQDHARRTGAVFIHPFNHPDVIAGQGTVGLEIARQVPEVRTVVVACGGGGLLSGVAVAVRALAPGARVIGVQAEQVAAFPPSLAAGHPVALGSTVTMADGIAVAEPGEVTLEHVRELVAELVTVTEDGMARALLQCLERAKQVVEPAGAAAVAALLEHADRIEPPACVVLSGGNIDPLLLSRVINHGMDAAGRYLAVRIQLPDRPGSLAALLATIGELGANVLDVAHSRVGGTAPFGQVSVALSLETRGRSHRVAVLRTLREAGYPIIP
jgi:threonine dehydratase